MLPHIIISFSLILSMIALDAWADANKELRKTEALYNAQPRVKQRRAKLKWTGRIMSLITLKK